MPSIPLQPRSGMRPLNGRELEVYTAWSEISRNMDTAYRESFNYLAQSQWQLEESKEPIPEVKWEKCEVSEGYALIDGQLRKVK